MAGWPGLRLTPLQPCARRPKECCMAPPPAQVLAVYTAGTGEAWMQHKYLFSWEDLQERPAWRPFLQVLLGQGRGMVDWCQGMCQGMCQGTAPRQGSCSGVLGCRGRSFAPTIAFSRPVGRCHADARPADLWRRHTHSALAGTWLCPAGTTTVPCSWWSGCSRCVSGVPTRPRRRASQGLAAPVSVPGPWTP